MISDFLFCLEGHAYRLQTALSSGQLFLAYSTKARIIPELFGSAPST